MSFEGSLVPGSVSIAWSSQETGVWSSVGSRSRFFGRLEPSLPVKLSTKPQLPRIGERSGSLEQLLLLSKMQQPAVRGAARGTAPLSSEPSRRGFPGSERPHFLFQVLLWWSGTPGHSCVPVDQHHCQDSVSRPSSLCQAHSHRVFPGNFMPLLS